MKKVSVIIATYGRSHLIKRAILSVMNQYNINSEIIVVDDNGLGSEEQKLVELELKDLISEKKVKYIPHKKNMNGSQARNTGILNATGEYISFLDDDDWIEEKKLYKQINLMEKEKTEASLCGFQRVYKDHLVVTSIPDLIDSLKKKLLAFDVDTCAGSCLTVKRTLIDKVGLFDVSFKRHQDLEFLYRISNYTNISVVKDILVNVEIHDGNTKLRTGEETELNRLHFIQRFEEDIVNMNEKDKKDILDKHYIEISKGYLKNKKISKSIKWLLKTSNIFTASFKISKDAYRYLIANRIRRK